MPSDSIRGCWGVAAAGGVTQPAHVDNAGQEVDGYVGHLIIEIRALQTLMIALGVLPPDRASRLRHPRPVLLLVRPGRVFPPH